MFRVDVDTLEAYFAFDPKREGDLRRLDALISKAAPSLKRHFHKGTPAGEPGMRFKMIGYGKSFYHATTGEKVAWPVVGVALQKNYISVYFGKWLIAAVRQRRGSSFTPALSRKHCRGRRRKFARPR
jgi:hypothetical protein